MSFLSTQQRDVVEQLSQQENTPFYLYDLDKLATHLSALTSQSVVKLWYAVKANPLSEVIKTLDKCGFDFDVASSGELNQVLAQGIDAKRVLNTGPAKSKQQIQNSRQVILFAGVLVGGWGMWGWGWGIWGIGGGLFSNVLVKY